MSVVSLPQLKGANVLTHSRMACFKRCPREHFYKYELGIRPQIDAAPLRIGSMVHAAIDFHARGVSAEGVIDDIHKKYDDKAASMEGADVDRLVELDVERVTVVELVWAYFQTWKDDYTSSENVHPLTPVECIASEQAFRLPILNPATGKATTAFAEAGKVDMIVRLADGRVALKETKTTGESLDEASDYWRKLRLDHQISMYIEAAGRCGHNCETVLYDVIRKPSIEPRQVPTLDDQGLKIVRDEQGERVKNNNGTWKQAADSTKGWTLVTRLETPNEFAERLRADIASRPEWYFQRKEIPRLYSDIEEFREELWQQQQAIREAQKHGRWYRNTAQCSAMGRCAFLDICHAGIQADAPPAGFVRVTDLHPELTGD